MSVKQMRNQFARNLRTLRKRAGFSQDALAEVSGLHRTEVNLLERGKRSPRVETLVILARSLGLPSTHEPFNGLHLTALCDGDGGVACCGAGDPTPLGEVPL